MVKSDMFFSPIKSINIAVQWQDSFANEMFAEKRFKMEDKKYSTECETGKCLKGIVCDAAHCAYNNGHNACCAKQITVGPADADCSSDTVCATFKPKTY